ncbi:hypothetical protein [Pelagibius sp.]|nr:hypothetical protein [Pelagibius sp.]
MQKPVSPYLRRPLRSLQEVLRDRGYCSGCRPLPVAQNANGLPTKRSA